MKKMPDLELVLNRRAIKPIRRPRPVKISVTGPNHPTPATKAAGKLTAASRENVGFLNRSLKRFLNCLELPPLVDNVLYLAYTIKVRDKAPFAARELREWLEKAGIETKSEFSFVNSGNFAGLRGRGADSADTFCLGCHQYLGIVDLEHIVNTISSFFAHYDITGPNDINRD